MTNIELNSLTMNELRQFMEGMGEKAYRGEQLFSYLNKTKGLDIDEIHTLSKGLREKLKKKTKVNNANIFKRFDSRIDDTKKYLFALEDENIIESVLMKYEHGYSICISTQVGCRRGCKFCASTKDGLVRNLKPAEMLNQIYLVEKDLNINISNIVLMGSGEPLDNYGNTMKFLKIIHDPKGHNTSYRNITLSTCGIVPKIYKLAEEDLPITLSISLHSPFNEYREKIMPIARKYNIQELMKACEFYIDKVGRRVTLEYTLIEKVNDRQQDVKELIKIIKNLNIHVNLIPLNPIEEFSQGRPSKDSTQRFYEELKKENIPVTIRAEKGGDIQGSCGQLRRRYIDS